jgi:hypothetical protein
MLVPKGAFFLKAGKAENSDIWILDGEFSANGSLSSEQMLRQMQKGGRTVAERSKFWR